MFISKTRLPYNGRMKISLIDIGSNLTHESFTADRDAVMARALDAGVRRQVVTGTDLQSSMRAAALAAEHPAQLSSTAGFHPHHAQSFDPHSARNCGSCCAGRRSWRWANAAWTISAIFRRPMRSARPSSRNWKLPPRSRKPVFLHQRDAHDDFAAILKEFRGGLVGGVAHCFTGGPAELDRIPGARSVHRGNRMGER